MKIKSILFQNRPPQYKGALWIKPEKDGSMSLWVYNARKWQSVGSAGGHDVVIKRGNDGNYVVEKGDLKATIDKITAGEYVDVLVYGASEGLEGAKFIDSYTIGGLSTDGETVEIDVYNASGSVANLLWDETGVTKTTSDVHVNPPDL